MAASQISGVAGPENAAATDLIYLDARQVCAAHRKISGHVRSRSSEHSRAGKTILEVADPKFAFAKAAAWLLPRATPNSSIHSTAIVAPTAKIAANVSIGPYAVIEEEAEIGAGTTIGAFAF